MKILYVVQGSATSKWTKFARGLVSAYPSYVKLLSAETKPPRNAKVLVPYELAKPYVEYTYLYLSSIYQLENISHLLLVCQFAAKLFVETEHLLTIAREKLQNIPIEVLPLDARDSRWSALLKSKATPVPARIEVHANRIENTAILGQSTPASLMTVPGEVLPEPTAATVIKDQSLIYAINSTYQAEHIIPLIKLMPADILLPLKQFQLLSGTEILKQYPDLSGVNSRIIPIGYPTEFKAALKRKFMITTGSFHRLVPSDYPRSLFVCHGISDKLGYHSRAARANFTYYASSGPRFTELYRKHGIPESRIIKSGYIRAAIKAAEYPKFDILYAPTHRAGTVSPYILPIIDACNKLGYKLKIRLHPLTEPHIVRQFAKRMSPYLVDGNVSTWSLLSAADHVITDVSSIAYEALLLRKDMLLIEGNAGWTRVSKLPSGKFGAVVPVSHASQISGYLKSLMQGGSKSRVPVEDVFYIDRDPATEIKKFLIGTGDIRE